MYIVLCYDVNEKRCGKYLNVCKKYLLHLQSSVFAGSISESKYSTLMKEIDKIKIEEDKILIYKTPSIKYVDVVSIPEIGIIES